MKWVNLPGRRVTLVAAGFFCAAAITMAADAVVDANVRGVADLLQRQVDGQIADDDFVWAPSHGVISDMFLGRWVAFLARAGGEPNRDVYAARVRVTRKGRPLAVTMLRRLTDTPFGDESQIAVEHGTLAFATIVEGRIRALTLLDKFPESLDLLSEASPTAGVTQVTLDVDPGHLDFEVQDREVVLALDRSREPMVVDRIHGAMLGRLAAQMRVTQFPRSALVPEPEPWVPRRFWPGFGGVGMDPSKGPAEGVPELGAPSIELASATVAADPVIVRRSAGSGTELIAFDMRQLDAVVVPGWADTTTKTGVIADGRWTNAMKQRAVAVLLGPSAEPSAWLGVRTPQLVQPMAPAYDVVSSSGGKLHISPTGLLPSPYEAALQLPTMGGAGLISMGANAGLCISDAGQLAYISEPPKQVSDLTRACRAFGGQRIYEISRHDRQAGVWVRDGESWRALWGGEFPISEAEANRLHHIVFLQREVSVQENERQVTWVASEGSQPTPSFLPALWEATDEEYEETVRLMRIDKGRLVWEVRAGTEERSHRYGGDFPEQLGDGDRQRAIVAIGLGVGKRRGPRGLRIDGSTGHRFGQAATILAILGEKMNIYPHGSSDPERWDDAVELELSVADGEVTPRARARGPRQRRVDLCSVGNSFVLAEAVFDSHEVNARVLARMGCSTAVMLDRGAEREGWIRQQPALRDDIFVETALIGLDAPLRGGASSFPIGD